MSERRSAREILTLVTDPDTFGELPSPPRESRPDGPLGWAGYDASRARAADRTGEEESVVCGTASVDGTRAVLIAFEFGFLGGSLGERTGDRLEAAYAHARAHRLPVVPLIATGGSRMQEGMLALSQLQRVARQSALTRAAGLPQIAVLRDPTTGGGWATLGAGADIVLALPGAQVGFAGSRVRPPAADPRAYTAESQLAAGAADEVVPPAELKGVLGAWLRLLTNRPPDRFSAPPGAAASPTLTAADTPTAPAAGSLAAPAAETPVAPSVDSSTVPATHTLTAPSADSPATPATETPVAPSADSPTVPATHTPTAPSADSPAAPATHTPAAPSTDSPAAPATDTPTAPAGAGSVRSGSARLEANAHPASVPADPSGEAGGTGVPEGYAGCIEPAPVPVALGAVGLPAAGWDAVRRARAPERPRAHAYLDAYFSHRRDISGDRCGGTDPDGMLCGFGERDGRTVAYAAQTGAATRPAGYRTAARLIRLADRLGIPVLTLVDTPGAANDAEAERQGAGAAIAEVFGAVAAARVPVTTLVIGEGGSGGALALAAPGNTWATPDSYFSVIAPELAAAILKRPKDEIEATAEQLRIRPQDLVELGVVRGIVHHRL
ncbi:carboxyl transferase domain-containing protein [Streptomyces sp. NPDC052101]|uniref:carboxyl transferase domain-containing protein n=1 Tax=Streptomyces sp. NPDC052101 TaxID=3155763 RepID=UPI00342B168E